VERIKVNIPPHIEELLQARLDGEIAGEEAAFLEAQIATDPAVRARAAELDTLGSILFRESEQDDISDIPAGMVAAVMSSIAKEDTNHTGERTTRSIYVEGGLMTRKVLWAVAGVAAVIVALVIGGYVPPSQPGSQATIGAATRAQSPQMSDKDVVLGDADAQVFLQSDTFDRLIKDDGARKLLSSSGFKTAIASLRNPQLVAALSAQELYAALRTPELKVAFADANFLTALARPELQSMLRADLVKALSAPELKAAMANADLRAAFRTPELQAALTIPQIRQALADANIRVALASSDLRAALVSPAFNAALSARGFTAALQTPQLVSALQAR
jgi:hypothetical protein